MEHQRIKFQGNDYIIVGGAITTPEAYSNGLCSYAHLMRNGEVKRFGKVIGKRRDIEFLDESVEAEPTGFQAFANMLDPDEWPIWKVKKGGAR